MSSFDDITLPDESLNPTDLDLGTNQGKFDFIVRMGKDIWWRVCSRSGLSKLIAAFADGILTRPVNVLDANWKPTNETVWAGLEIGALRQNFKNVKASADAAKASADAATAAVNTLNSNLAVQVNKAVAAALAGVQVTATTDNKAIANEVVDVLYARIKSNTTTGA